MFKSLFISDHCIESLDGVSRNLNQPAKYANNPVLPIVPKSRSSWDADMRPSFSSVIFDDDEKLFKMWYSLWERDREDEATVLAYATSRDGIVWDKPSLGIFSYRGTTENNLVKIGCSIACGVFKDPHEMDAAKRYKMLYTGIGITVYASHSPDGLHWTPYNYGQEVIPEGRDTHAVPYWDEQLGKYVAIVRERSGRIKDIRKQLISDPKARETYLRHWGGRVPEVRTVRRVGQAVSDDFEHWGPVRVIVEADSEDPINREAFYNMEVILYEGLRVGLMTVFSYDPQYPRSAIQLTCSRDGMNWFRAGDRGIFLPPSDQSEDFDWGGIYPLQGPLVVGDEIWIYYTGCAADHNGFLPTGTDTTGTGLAKLRLDGFVSVDADAREGTLTTKSFTPDGQALVINADASKQGGYVLVEILNAEKKPIARFGKADCDAFNGDEIRHIVTWHGGSSLERFKGTTIALRFYLKEAKLFSYKVK